ncbi:zinc finger and SCAN domain-containing protein 2-like isoform X1 [Electrophorus electricus]|uniref:zinc finger and SCAN domain-containing protein 2-like isoform X1 n=1 Tax=Electrophorus electricus TaxID=8005 RepID=UPI0015D0AA8B|nr:zinc finger and SCAN domain-containing protein 2-like isoform X1 [Electrophorus electricus]
MTKMEYLNSFFVNRLMAAAGEIFDAVKDAVSGYQQEVERTKQENRRLMRMLAEMKAVSMETSPADVHASDADGVVSENQNFNQGPLVSDPSLIQLELATMKQEADTQLNEVPTRISPCAKSAHDTQTSHADGALEQQIPCQGPQDSKSSLIQVKLELATIAEEEKVPHQQLSVGKHAYDQDAVESGTFTTLDTDERNGCDLHANPFISLQSEPCDSEARHYDNKDLSAAVIQSLQRKHLNTMNGKQIYEKLSSVPEHSQNHLSKKMFGCDETFGSASSTNKHVTAWQEEKVYRCDLCGKCYACARILKAHLKAHTTERPFHCSVCGKTFKLKNHLKDHERTHTGDKRYSCSACGMSFIWTNQVKVHIQNHHRGQSATVISKSVKKRGTRNIF